MSTALTITREELNEATVKLNIICPPELIRSGINKAIKKLSKQIRIPGFRPGQAPAHLVQQAVGEGEIMGQAAEEIVREALVKALTQESLEPVSRPVIDLEKFEREPAEFVFTAKVPLSPIVELGDYLKLPAARPKIEITDQDVDQQIEALRQREGKRESVTDRGIDTGDMAVVNIKIEGGDGEGRTFMTIAGQTFPDLDSQLLGMKAEDMKQAELSFPSTFQEKDWADQTHRCTITIRSVNTIRLPELDDEFAKRLKTESVEELRSRIKARLEQSRLQVQTNAINEQLMDALTSRSKVVVATTTWEGVADRRLGEIEADLKEKGGTLETHAASQNMTVQELAEALKKEAKVHVERAILIERVFRQEQMEISDQEAQVHFMDVLIQNGVSMDDAPKFMKDFGNEVREEVLYRAINAKVMEFLTLHAEVTDEE
jgi:trigger factor